MIALVYLVPNGASATGIMYSILNVDVSHEPQPHFTNRLQPTSALAQPPSVVVPSVITAARSRDPHAAGAAMRASTAAPSSAPGEESAVPRVLTLGRRRRLRAQRELWLNPRLMASRESGQMAPPPRRRGRYEEGK